MYSLIHGFIRGKDDMSKKIRGVAQAPIDVSFVLIMAVLLRRRKAQKIGDKNKRERAKWRYVK
jgi:hypothetical protein